VREALPDFPARIGDDPSPPILPDLPDRISCRAATRSDFIFLRRLYAAGRKSELVAAGMPAKNHQDFCDSQFACQHRDWVERFPTAQFLILTRGTRPIGRLYLNSSGEGIHIVDIAFLPDWQGQGLGAAVIAGLQRQASARGGAVTLHVAMENAQAASLYRRLGFQVEHRTERHVLMRWNPPAG